MAFYFWRQSITIYFRLALNLQSSCLSLLYALIMGMSNHAWLFPSFGKYTLLYVCNDNESENGLNLFKNVKLR
jgi:hypothetical protein